MQMELSSPLPFILIPQVPVLLFALRLAYVQYWLGTLITMPQPAPPVGKLVKVQSIGGNPPAGLRQGGMYKVTWSKGYAFRMRRIVVPLWWNLMKMRVSTKWATKTMERA